MRKFQVEPDRTIFVGDMFIDAQTGKRAKVKTVMLTTGSSRKEELEKERPQRIISRLTGLMKLV